MKEVKTNVMRILDKAKIPYEMHTYNASDKVDGITVSNALGIPTEKVFKTLVTRGKNDYFVFVIPVDRELDLKKAAKSVSEKSVEMIAVKDINKATGYIRGGCSPVGMKKLYTTRFDKTAEDLETFVVSGGKIGFQVEANPKAIAEFIGAEFTDLLLHD